MDTLPECQIHIIYEYKHEMIYSKVMKQIKTYRVNHGFIVSLELLEYGYYEFGEFGGIITPYINSNNITSTPYEKICIIYHKRDMLSNR